MTDRERATLAAVRAARDEARRDLALARRRIADLERKLTATEKRLADFVRADLTRPLRVPPRNRFIPAEGWAAAVERIREQRRSIMATLPRIDPVLPPRPFAPTQAQTGRPMPAPPQPPPAPPVAAATPAAAPAPPPPPAPPEPVRTLEID